MLTNAQLQITSICDDADINKMNYLDSLQYASTIYSFINRMKTVISVNSVRFLPTFYGMNASQRLAEEHYGKESEMKLIKLESASFFVDELANALKERMAPICEEISIENDVMTFILI